LICFNFASKTNLCFSPAIHGSIGIVPSADIARVLEQINYATS
jgi:hypothetical protein